ncbi:hypothetical protein KUTeg_024256 [Tegillarca granosa]|uniref:Cadherin domain-containing protein n=1 Tax=Tegillarca granosa TaxID=220873 RepID=A0ABQ9DXV3_TEGGR|nr:hypothetical protein KUTeg_024256 [Tegillarca granosa]
MIFIQDENDNAPAFPAYSPISVKEDREIDYPVFTVIAVDNDSNVNNSGFGVVSYEIVDGNQDNKFYIDTKTDKYEINSIYSGSLEIEIDKTIHTGLCWWIFFYFYLIDNYKSILRIKQTLDREVKDRYILNISASDHGSPRQESFTSLIINVEDVNDNAPHFDAGNPMRYDTATVIINVTDTNDNAPEFDEKVVTLKIPENTEQTNIHMAVAGDKDIGENAKIVYSGNEDQMFTIQPETGRLSCKQLDREGKHTYNLTIMGRDLGQPSRPGYCNVLVSVTDQNDNDPREDVAIGSMVLQVSASDADEGTNGHVTYSLGNDTDGLFQVDSETGNITTNRAFDREKNSSITFVVIAKDGGLYDIRNATARVTVKITDVNDNYPIFQQIPYRKNLSAGAERKSTIMAEDKDEGLNGKVTYSITNSQFFRIDDNTGEIFTSQTLDSNALGYHYLQILAVDLGTPPLRSEGVVVVHVGSDSGATGLRFTNQTYYRTLQENSAVDTFVQIVTAEFVGMATGTISYRIVSVNSETAFRVDQATGNIYVKDPSKLDYEQNPTMHVFLSASSGVMNAYTTLVVNLQDVNDNAPRFAQDRYYTSTWEEQKINTFVTQVMAVDLDSGQNADITYNIISGDDDRVFDIFPPHSGIVRTKFPLDFETRKSYRLVIEAVDHGLSPKSGTCILKVDVVDINDQAPKFPNSPPVNISEGREVGAFVAQITANDVDKNSILLYDFGSHGNPDDTFSIDRLSGRLTLAKKLDRESRSHYDIGLVVNDTKFAAMTILRVNVDDINDNAPVFMQQSYQKTLEETTPANTPVITVNATDADAGVNAQITYKMDIIQTQGFRIDQQTGTIYTSQTVVYNPDQQIILIVKAEDGGVPPMSSVVAVHIQITRVNRYSPVFSHTTYRRSISEDARKGISVLRVSASDRDDNQELDYSIISQGSIPFQINQKNGDITLSGSLDRDTVPEYRFVVGVTDHGTPVKSSSTEVILTVDDVNDQAPYFVQKSYYAELNESYPSEHTFLSVRAKDNDIGLNAEIQYTITSGNDDGLFIVHGRTGDIVIMSNMSLDYEKKKMHTLIVCATDCPKCPSTVRKLSAFVSVTVNVTDVNDHSPVFHVPFYYSSVFENQTENTKIFQAHAIDKDGGPFGVVTYQLLGSNLFKINKTSGWVSTNVRFDFENLNDLPPNTYSYRFRITASDISGNTAEVSTVIRIKDLDESDPVFTKEKYSFGVRGDAKPGTIIGRVVALDKDKGEAGRVYYSLKYANDYFDIENTKGDVFVKRKFSENVPVQSTRVKRELSAQDVTLVIEASTGMENSRKSTAVLNIEVDESCAGCRIQAQKTEAETDSQTTIILVVVFVILAVILIIVIVLLLIRNRFRKAPKTVAQVYEGAFDEGFDFLTVQVMEHHHRMLMSGVQIQKL